MSVLFESRQPPAAPPMITVTVDGRPVQAPAGATVLEAVNRSGTYLPQFCKDPDQKPMGACRTCLVEVEGQRGFPASCGLPARDGMVVRTSGPSLDRIRRGVIELTLGMHPDPCRAIEEGRPCDLHAAAVYYGIGDPPFDRRPRSKLDETKSFFTLDMAQCILCQRCTTACNNVQHIGAIAIIGKNQRSEVGPVLNKPMQESICTSCGQCVAACPTNAIAPKEPPRSVAREVETTCPYCGVGCGILARIDDRDRFLGMMQDVPENKSSAGMLCVKGRFGTEFVHHPERLRTPLIRRNGEFVEATWDEALDLVADKLIQYRDSVATLASAKATNEDAYIQQKLFRALLGTNNIDHCTRLCHSPSVAAMLSALGSGATSNSYTDYAAAGCLMIVGSDASANHPVIAVRFREAVQDHGAKLIVVNPRRIDLCDYADIWLRPKPGTDVALFNGLAKIIVDENLWDREFVAGRTENFEAWLESLEPYTVERVAEVTGIPADDLIAAARMYARPPFSGSCLIWGMGITQHISGTANAHGLINLALVTGQMGRPGNGISPLRGQNNVQGCGDAGCIPDNLPGYQGLGEAARRAFGAVWGAEPPAEPGLTVTQMVEEAALGRLKMMYVVGENPLLGEPHLKHAKEALENLEFLIVQDIFPHETSDIADVILPATSFAEKDGTFTNSERRVQRVRQLIPPLPGTRPDWEILADLGRRISERLGRDPRQFAYRHPEEIFAEMAGLTPIIAGLNYERLEHGGVQWPCRTLDDPGTPRLYQESFPRGLGKFVPIEQGPTAAELPDPDYPLILNTGRVLYHWHGGTLTRRVNGLLALYPELAISIHPEDAAHFGLTDRDPVRLESRRGDLTGVALITDAVRPGEVFIPFVRLGESAANFLTNAAFDPLSDMPEYKVCAVRIEKLPGGPVPLPAEFAVEPTDAPEESRKE
ncbi:MAG TPA: formate dehydrogenase subunit alpha [Dehalococcoidia bacterium]|nr:formate dehydrogenase subunit alpha [Dehalococcoidia bacterium]